MLTGFASFNFLFLDNTVASYFLFILYILLGIIFIRLVSYLFDRFFKIQEEKNTRYDLLFKILRKPEPILFIIFVSVLKEASKVFNTSTMIAIAINKFTFSLYVLLAAWFVVKSLIAVIEKYLQKFSQESEDIKRYEYLRPLIKMLLKIFIFIIAILIIISNLGFNISGLIAGLGIGGVALAFASKELLENFFSGIIIYTERPFKVGDWIKANDGQISGTVIAIGIRTTKIRSFDGTIHIVPNYFLSGKTLENMTLMPARRIFATLSISNNNTFEQIEKAKKIIYEAIKVKQKKKELLEEYHIFFDKFSTFSMDITYVYWINKNIGFWDQMDVKDSLNRDIKKELDKANIELSSVNKNKTNKQSK